MDEDALLFKDHLNGDTGKGDIRSIIHVLGQCSIQIGDMNWIGIFFNVLAVDVNIFYGIEMLLLSYALKQIEYGCHGFCKLTRPTFEEAEFVCVKLSFSIVPSSESCTVLIVLSNIVRTAKFSNRDIPHYAHFS